MGYITFVILSFEGPDPYSHAGGLGTRVTELSKSLSDLGFQTHLFFVGDPARPGYESSEDGKLHIHRWCQWISQYHPDGVYDGEEGKLYDWNNSLPFWLEANLLEPEVAAGNTVVIMGEEWQMERTIIALNDVVLRRGWQRQVHLLWNANNTFSFHRVDWERLKEAASITTVSRYMKHVMWGVGVDPWVVPNGIPERWTQPTNGTESLGLSLLIGGRLTLAKVARWDPDKRWDMAVDAVAEMKRLGHQPLFLARGGLGPHGDDVMDRAARKGLQVALIEQAGPTVKTLTTAIRPELAADMIVVKSYLSEAQRQVLFHTASAVLANSGIEPFGLVGLETMAVGGVAFVGSTGEDYVTPGFDAVSLQSNNPQEIVYHSIYLHSTQDTAHQLRQAARNSAVRYTWPSIIQRSLLPLVEQLEAQFTVSSKTPAPSPDITNL